MLKMLRGVTHEVWSGVCVISGDKCAVGAECTKVKMGDISDLSIERYIADGEPFGKAGAYAIQGIGNKFIEKYYSQYILKLAKTSIFAALNNEEFIPPFDLTGV